MLWGIYKWAVSLSFLGELWDLCNELQGDSTLSERKVTGFSFMCIEITTCTYIVK